LADWRALLASIRCLARRLRRRFWRRIFSMEARLSRGLNWENQFLLHWDKTAAFVRRHGTTHKHVFGEERKALLPLPRSLFPGSRQFSEVRVRASLDRETLLNMQSRALSLMKYVEN